MDRIDGYITRNVFRTLDANGFSALVFIVLFGEKLKLKDFAPRIENAFVREAGPHTATYPTEEVVTPNSARGWQDITMIRF